MKPFLALMLLFINFQTNIALQGDVIDDLSAQFKLGNAKEIGKSFANTVELIITDQEDVYSKAQSEQILKDFFVKNVPTKSTILHRLNSNPNYRYGILSLNTKNGNFRVTITLKLQKTSNAFLINELRIEPDKE